MNTDAFQSQSHTPCLYLRTLRAPWLCCCLFAYFLGLLEGWLLNSLLPNASHSTTSFFIWVWTECYLSWSGRKLFFLSGLMFSLQTSWKKENLLWHDGRIQPINFNGSWVSVSLRQLRVDGESFALMLSLLFEKLLPAERNPFRFLPPTRLLLLPSLPLCISKAFFPV